MEFMHAAGRRNPVKDHMPQSGMVPVQQGYLPTIEGNDFGRGTLGHGRLELSLADVKPAAAPFTPFRGQQRSDARVPFGAGRYSDAGRDSCRDSERSFGGYSMALATQAPESRRSMLSTPPASQRASRDSTPRVAPGRSSRGGTPPPSQRRSASYSTTSHDVGLNVAAPSGLRTHFAADQASAAQPTSDGFKRAVGGVVPGYGGFVPNATTHYGTSHLGGVATSAASPLAQVGHGDHVTRMDERRAAEVAGHVASHVAAASIPGYKGHVPGQDTGEFGSSTWKGMPQYGYGSSPISSNAHTGRRANERSPYVGEAPRMANLERWAA